ncbi:hypothetical protein P8452_46059 [Trifolium repens]|jgi:hypothetical protein|nr:hypothetical protein P8452_46059 [Trifolium repens]
MASSSAKQPNSASVSVELDPQPLAIDHRKDLQSVARDYGSFHLKLKQNLVVQQMMPPLMRREMNKF